MIVKPRVHETCFVASSAMIIGDVVIGKNCSVWPNAVIRGDQNSIRIGDGSNVQDCCVIHTDREHPINIGKNVSIGHGAVIHGASIEDDCLIGMHATVMNGARVRRGSIVGANALVKADMDVPENSLVLGIPGKIVKQDESFLEMIRSNAITYQNLAEEYKEGKHYYYYK
ncbi:isoleucine patch superfamily enzyme, carbonic anhydrase/acetyltransferase [Thermoplasmatales archaeon SCGC AB-539-N05]|nr:isoleucine patch superfamily enzyme, carbonic anhydrase/acetyltransferase [Thermoplasmatales archaeon SCGC AB-539-N05]